MHSDCNMRLLTAGGVITGSQAGRPADLRSRVLTQATSQCTLACAVRIAPPEALLQVQFCTTATRQTMGPRLTQMTACVVWPPEIPVTK